MMPARLAPSVCQAKRASSGPCCRSLGHTRNTYGLIPDRSGLDADGEIIGVGVAPPPMISPSASSPALSGMTPYVFRVCPSDLQHGPELARFAWHTLGARRAGIIY